MTNNKDVLTRRKILASISVVGMAGAGAGVGTRALLGDEESFANESITAGELDLKVDWEEHYSFPQIYGFDDPTQGLDVTRAEPGDSGYVGLPDPADPVVWVHQDDLDTYISNTAIEAFPDPDNDGEQETEGSADDAVANGFSYNPCEDGADLSGDLRTFDETGTDVAVRTKNGDTFDEGQSDPAEPLISLEDVKPGDFGKLTLSFHLCDNPGYVWLRADGFQENENDIVGPEADVDSTPSDPELAENIQTVLWYDSADGGNNVLDGSSSETVITRRSLADLITNVLDTPLPLDGDLTSDFDELNDDADNSARECFPAGKTHYVGFGWWLPEDVGNEIQSDSLRFDFGFYTEQCRNNDGSYDGS